MGRETQFAKIISKELLEERDSHFLNSKIGLLLVISFITFTIKHLTLKSLLHCPQFILNFVLPFKSFHLISFIVQDAVQTQ